MALDHFFFNDAATTEIYTLSLHDALPISRTVKPAVSMGLPKRQRVATGVRASNQRRSLPDLPGSKASTATNTANTIARAYVCTPHTTSPPTPSYAAPPLPSQLSAPSSLQT